MTKLRSAFLIVLIAAVHSGPGCAPILYYGVKETHTYDYDRRVPVTVDSEPSGATIVGADGTVLGQAPIVVYENVRVRRVHRSNNIAMLLLGCAVDVSGYFAALWYINNLDNEALRVTAGVTALVMGESCFNLAIIKLAAVIGAPMMKAQHRRPLFTGTSETEEHTLSRTLDLVGRWDGLGEVRTRLALPEQRATTFRLRRRYTLDEALVLWARDTNPPATAENLYRVGTAYRHLALEGAFGAADHARELFTHYLENYASDEHAAEIRRALDELNQREGFRR